METDKGVGSCTIVDSHTNIIKVNRDDVVLFERDKDDTVSSAKKFNFDDTTIKDLREFVETVDFEDIKFLRKLFDIKDQVKNLERIQKILPREKEILAFIGYKEGKKILFLSNLTEKEVLVELAYKVLDYKDYEFLFGSITHRSLYRTIVLRPYEALAFINCK